VSLVGINVAVNCGALRTDAKVRPPLGAGATGGIEGDFLKRFLVGLKVLNVQPVGWNRFDAVAFIRIAIKACQTNSSTHRRTSSSLATWSLSINNLAAQESQNTVKGNAAGSEKISASVTKVAPPQRSQMTSMARAPLVKADHLEKPT
jgi:hypothetical protein